MTVLCVVRFLARHYSTADPTPDSSQLIVCDALLERPHWLLIKVHGGPARTLVTNMKATDWPEGYRRTLVGLPNGFDIPRAVSTRPWTPGTFSLLRRLCHCILSVYCLVLRSSICLPSIQYVNAWSARAKPQNRVIHGDQLIPPAPSQSSIQKNALMITNTPACQRSPERYFALLRACTSGSRFSVSSTKSPSVALLQGWTTRRTSPGSFVLYRRDLRLTTPLELTSSRPKQGLKRPLPWRPPEPHGGALHPGSSPRRSCKGLRCRKVGPQTRHRQSRL